MRTRRALFSCAIMAASATAAMAADPLPTQCTTSDGLWAISTTGPTSTATGMKVEYQVTAISPNSGSPDHVATLAGTLDKTNVVFPTANQVYDPCVGDPVSLLGLFSCHEVAAKINSVNNVTAPKVEVKGATPILTSVAVKKGTRGKISSCAIVGLGHGPGASVDACVPNCGGFNVNQVVRTVETFKFKGCEIGFRFSATTGEFTDFYLVDDTSPNVSCAVSQGVVSDLFVSGGPLAGANTDVTYGDGWISSGNDSCGTRLIAGRYCTVCQ